MAPHSSTLAWQVPWTEEPGRLQSQFFYVFNFFKRMYRGKLNEKPENLSLIILYTFLFSYYYAISISRLF